MKVRLYQPCNDGIYLTIPDNMLVSNPEHFYPAADYEALEAKLAALVGECERVLINTPLYGYNLEPRDILRQAIDAAKVTP